MEMLGESVIPHPGQNTKAKATRKRPGTSGSTSARVRQSPIVKPRESKRKSTVSAQIPKEVSLLLDQAHKSQAASPMQQSLSIPASQSTSDGGSISPEPLSDAVMGPPPKPGSAIQSPAMTAQNDQFRSVGGVVPATPASLMRITNNKNNSHLNGGLQNQMSPPVQAQLTRNASSLEDLTLPESAVAAYALNNGATTPRASARPTPKLGPVNTSATSTPLASPLTPSFAGAKRGSTTDAKPGRGKKRNSTSISDGRPNIGGSTGSALISPALRPKISPSIKPLQPTSSTPNGPMATPPTPLATSASAGNLTITEQTAHLLLASKSNYQHLVDGTNVNVPGLEYPESLSTGLTSKRTSHKIAEQGRRNRINVALAEMGRLLPPELRGVKSPVLGAQDGKEVDAASPGSGALGAKKANGAAASGNGGNANAGHSKAATVESAILYIRLLQKQAEERESRILEKEKEIFGLKQRLGDPDTESKDGDATHDAEETEAKTVDSMEMDVVVERNVVVRAEDEGKDSDIDVDGRMEDG